MMDPADEIVPALSGIVELDEKYICGKPRYQQGVKHKRGKGTDKQLVLVAVERNSPVSDHSGDSDKNRWAFSSIARFVDKHVHLMSDENHTDRALGNCLPPMIGSTTATKSMLAAIFKAISPWAD